MLQLVCFFQYNKMSYASQASAIYCGYTLYNYSDVQLTKLTIAQLIVSNRSQARMLGLHHCMATNVRSFTKRMAIWQTTGY